MSLSLSLFVSLSLSLSLFPTVGTIAEFWARDLPMVVVCIVCEILLLGVAAVRCVLPTSR